MTAFLRHVIAFLRHVTAFPNRATAYEGHVGRLAQRRQVRVNIVVKRGSQNPRRMPAKFISTRIQIHRREKGSEGADSFYPMKAVLLNAI